MRESALDGLSHLQYPTFLSLCDKELVIVSPAVTVHSFRKKGEIKTVSVLTSLPARHPTKDLNFLVP